MNNILTAEQWNSFKWRVWNVFKSIVFPIVLSALYVQLQNHPNDLSCLGEVQFWLNMLYAVLLALVGAGLVGLDKVNRMKTAVNIEEQRVEDLK